MKYGLIEIDWGYVASQLSHEGDNTQATFFKAFVAECGTWGTQFQVEKQLASVNHLLADEEKDVLGMLSYKEAK